MQLYSQAPPFRSVVDLFYSLLHRVLYSRSKRVEFGCWPSRGVSHISFAVVQYTWLRINMAADAESDPTSSSTTSRHRLIVASSCLYDIHQNCHIPLVVSQSYYSETFHIFGSRTGSLCASITHHYNTSPVLCKHCTSIVMCIW